MLTNPYASLAIAAAIGLFLFPMLALVFRRLTVQVEDEEALLVTRFGRLRPTIRRPGLHWLPSRVLPWVRLYPVSLKRDFRHFADVHVNDARGTTIILDLWLEFRIVDPEKALFHVADWDRSLQNLVTHAVTAILGSRDLQAILHDRAELGELLVRDLDAETSRWGIQIELALVSRLSLRAEVSRQIFESVAARLERARSIMEERGRLDVAQLEADTSARVATLVAEAKGQYPLAIGRALEALGRRPRVRAAYTTLYELSQLRPHRTVAFFGFGEGEMSATDSAMLIASVPEGRALEEPSEGYASEPA